MIRKAFMALLFFSSDTQSQDGTSLPGKVIWQKEALTCVAIQAPDAVPYLDELTHCIEIYQEFPYFLVPIFDVDRAWFEHYCTQGGPGNVFLIAFEGKKIVGCAHALPLAAFSHQRTTAAFTAVGYDLAPYFYISDILIYQEYRGKGLMRCFIEYYEKLAHDLGFSRVVYATVERPGETMGEISKHFGYQTLPGINLIHRWKQTNTNQEEDNRMNVWCKQVIS